MLTRNQKLARKASQRVTAYVRHLRQQQRFYRNFGVFFCTCALLVLTIGTYNLIYRDTPWWIFVFYFCFSFVLGVLGLKDMTASDKWKAEADYEESLHLYDQTSVM